MATEMNHDRTVASVVAEIKEEMREFLKTRYEMLRAELSGKLKVWKLGVPLLLAAAGLFLVAFLLLSVCVACAIAVSFDTPYGWAYGFLIMGFFWLLIGGILAAFGYREIATAPLAPTRTMRVLKQDQAWITTEARSQI